MKNINPKCKLWVKKPGISGSEFISLCKEIEGGINLPISLEGLYKWIVFLPSRVRTEVPALNWFYSAFEDGRLKEWGK